MTDSIDFDLLRQLFDAAVQLPPEGRGVLFDRALNHSLEMKIELGEMLRHHDLAHSDHFLERTPSEESSSLGLIGRAVRSLDNPEAAPKIPGYEIEGVLGRGGMGIVWKAREVALNREVAIKIPLMGTYDPSVKARFLREAQAAAKLQHSGICPIHQVGEMGGQPYLVMPLLTGPTLRSWLDARSTTTEKDRSTRTDSVANTMRQSAGIVVILARALSVAHAAGIIHRDIKPSNVILTEGGRSPVLMDFGCAKDLDSTDGPVSLSGQFVGTPAYMSPEQANSKLGTVDARSDVYSLGIVLYELICGRPAFDGSAHEVLSAVSSEEPPAPRTISPQIPRDLETVCLKATAKAPWDRYQTAGEFADDLDRFLAGGLVLARRPSLWERGRRRLSRNRLISVLSGIAAVAILVSASLVWRMTVSGQRSLIQSKLQSGLDQTTWTLDTAEELDRNASRLEETHPTEASFFHRRITERMERETRQRVGRRDLGKDDTLEVDRWLNALAKRSSSAADQLRNEFDRRLRTWTTVLSFPSLDPDIHMVFKDSPFTSRESPSTTSGKVFALPDSSRHAVSLIPTKVSCDGNSELRMSLGNWMKSSVVGIRLVCGDELGYDLLMGSDDGLSCLSNPSHDQRPGSMEDSLKNGEAIRLQLRRNGLVIRERTLVPNLGSSIEQAASITISARREDGEIVTTLQGINWTETANAPSSIRLVFRDPFPLATRREDCWSLVWTTPTELHQVMSVRQLKSSKINTLQQGDDLFAKGEFQGALSFYEAQISGTETSPTDLDQEVRFKRGLCLSKLNRHDEATPIWSTLLNESGDRWPLVAGCHLWELLLRQGKTTESESVFAVIGSKYSPHDLLASVSKELRDSIVKSYRSDARGLTWLRRDPTRTNRLLQVESIEEMLGTDILVRAWTWWGLVRSAWADGNLELAADRAEKVMQHEVEVRWASVQFLMEYCALLRQMGSSHIALERLDQQLSRPLPPERGRIAPLLIERARTHLASGNVAQAEADLDEYFRQTDSNRERFYYFGDASLLRGFLRSDRGDAEGAVAAWREGFRACRLNERPAKLTSEGTELALASILGSLSGEIDDEGASVILTKAIELVPLGVFSGAVKRVVPLTPDLIRTIWSSDKGRELARKFSLRSLSPWELTREVCLLAGTSVAFRGAFAGQPTHDEQRLVDQVFSELFNAWSTRALSDAQAIQLVLLWKGQTLLGTSPSLPKELPTRTVPILAYLLGKRMAVLNRRDDAIQFIRQAKASPDATEELTRLCEQELTKLSPMPNQAN